MTTYNLATLLEDDGQLVEAQAAQAEAERAARRFGAGHYIRWQRYNTVDWKYMFGEWHEALARADELIAEFEAGTEHYLVTVPLSVRARIRSARADDAGATADVEKELEVARRIGDVQAVVPALAVGVVIAMEAGDARRANELADELFANQRQAHLEFRAPAPVVGAIERLGRLDAWLSTYENARSTPWLEAAERVRGGDWLGAAELYVLMGSPIDEALARLRAAEQLVRQGRRADADVQLARSLEFWRSVGASRYVAEGEALLAATA
jgi:ATP/maltotriose-dependent transcriptional regulator MalT